jgi:UPF0755 protein
MSNWLKRGLGILAMLGIAVAGSATWYYNNQISSPLNLQGHVLQVDRGDTLSSLGSRLVHDEILKEPYTLKVYARLNSINHIQAGEYQFPADLNIAELVRWLETGKGQVGIKVTIVEGWTFRQMREVLTSAPKLSQLTGSWTDQQIMTELGYPDLHPEGQFYPDTYHYLSGESDLTIYKKAFDLMQQILDAAWQNRKPEIEIKDKYQALIMASIVEKESQDWDEQPEISGVFNNRLRKGMRLQTDPTVIYGVGDEYNGDITRKHLKTDTPYNTYTRHGLPPTPISLPGARAITAAVNPAQTKSLYFVAKGAGQHYFSKTLKEHNAAVQKYIFKKKSSG